MVLTNTIFDRFDLTDEEFNVIQATYANLEPLLDDYLNPEQKRAMRLEVCQRLGIAERTLYQYLKDFREKGGVSLIRKRRSDSGIAKKVTAQLLDKVKELLKQDPHRSIPFILKLLAADETMKPVAESVTPAAIHKQLKKAGFDIRKERNTHEHNPFRRFESLYANHLWQSDARDGITLPYPEKKNAQRKTYLFAFIDDFSRKLLFAKYYWDEKLPRLEDCMRQAILRWGIPERLYVDNGSAYISRQFTLIVSALGIRKIHHPPYQAWCKGKVESLMKRIKQFQREAAMAGFKTIEELNATLAAWIEVEYNQKIHSSTGESPNVRYQNSLASYPPKRITDIDAFNAHFLWRERRVVDKYGFISLRGNKYRIRDIGCGETIELRFDPFDLSRIHVYRNAAFVSTVQAYKLTRIEYAEMPEETKKPAAVVSKEAQQYFTAIREKHLQDKAENAFRISNIVQEDDDNA